MVASGNRRDPPDRFGTGMCTGTGRLGLRAPGPCWAPVRPPVRAPRVREE